jgi:hypothetical protein
MLEARNACRESDDSHSSMSACDLAKGRAYAQARFPEFALPDVPPGDWDVRERIDNGRAQRELGLTLTPPAATLVDAAVTLIAVGGAQPLPSGLDAIPGAEEAV